MAVYACRCPEKRVFTGAWPIDAVESARIVGQPAQAGGLEDLDLLAA